MKTLFTAAAIATAALSLAACAKPDGEANLATAAEPSFNETDIPAEGNAGFEAPANDGFAAGNLAADNLSAPTGNEAAVAGNAL